MVRVSRTIKNLAGMVREDTNHGMNSVALLISAVLCGPKLFSFELRLSLFKKSRSPFYLIFSSEAFAESFHFFCKAVPRTHTTFGGQVGAFNAFANGDRGLAIN